MARNIVNLNLGGDEPTEKSIDQGSIGENSDLIVGMHDNNTSLTITNKAGSDKEVTLIQEVRGPDGEELYSDVYIGENANVHLVSVREMSNDRDDATITYHLGQGATFRPVQAESMYLPDVTLNLDMGSDAASTFIYNNTPYDDGVQFHFNVSGISPGDQIRVGAARTFEYKDSTMLFYDIYGRGVGGFKVEGLDANLMHFENGTMTYACYLKGTRIATPDGETKVEDLRAGDQVRTASGSINTVKWIGFRKLIRSQLPTEHALRASPIRICKSAFADNVPHRDLTVSPGHRFNFDGALVPALSLVNGLTIVQDFEIEQFEYYHVELEKFDMLLAEGAAAESYLEVGSNRNSFQNARTVTAYPDFGPTPRNVMLAQYVQKITPEIIEPIRRELFKRAEILTGAVRTPDTDLRIEFNGQVIGPQTPCKKKGIYRFELPAGLSGNIRILSNASVVRETSLTDRTDTRVIGVGLAGVALISNDQRCEIDLRDDPLTGFNDVQEMDGALMRWTTGEAVIPADLIPSSKGAATLELNILRTHMYWTSVAQSVVRKVA